MPGDTYNYTGQTASGNAKQHNGNVFGNIVHNYSSPSPSRQSVPKGRSRNDYTVGWVCALPVPEFQASQLLLDERHSDVPLPETIYQYVCGKINGHNVVMGCLPVASMGTTAASAVVTEMKIIFPKVRIGLLVGVGGGVWSEENDVRLGDVVVSQPDSKRQTGGVCKLKLVTTFMTLTVLDQVIQYDYGQAIQGGIFKETGSLNRPPESLLAALGAAQATIDGQFEEYLESYEKTQRKFPQYAQRPTAPDVLYETTFAHPLEALTCKKCDPDRQIDREDRMNTAPQVHFGTIASGDQVMKDSAKRDLIAKKHGIICFEMEAAGLVNRFPCLVIRGICDYCDSHKNKVWQPFAAAAAAAWAKELLRNIAPATLLRDTPVDEQD